MAFLVFLVLKQQLPSGNKLKETSRVVGVFVFFLLSPFHATFDWCVQTLSPTVDESAAFLKDSDIIRGL